MEDYKLTYYVHSSMAVGLGVLWHYGYEGIVVAVLSIVLFTVKAKFYEKK